MLQTKIIIYVSAQCLWISILGEDIKLRVPFRSFTRSFHCVDLLAWYLKYFSCCITAARTLATKLAKVVTIYKKLQPIKSQASEHLIMWGHVINWKYFITKPGKVVTYHEELPSIKSQETLIKQSGDLDLSYTTCRFRTQTPKLSPTSCCCSN